MKNLYSKLLLIQKELGAIKKEEDNPFFKSKYFDINALVEHVKPLLSKHGLVLIQPLTYTPDGKPGLQTRIVDAESGETFESTALLPENIDPQKMGSAITYFRRYAVQSLLFLQAEDDDANSVRPQYNKTISAPQAQSGEWEYKTGISKKNGKPWWGKQKPGSKDMIWLTEIEYAEQANGGKLTPASPTEAQAMKSQPDFVDESYDTDMPF